MYYSRKKAVEAPPTEPTSVWLCSKDGCIGWMRNQFALEAEPVCPLCQSPMASGMKDLPVLHDHSSGIKA